MSSRAQTETEHTFDRRLSDVNVQALATRMQGLEGRVEVLEAKQDDNTRELRANTELCRQMHVKVEDMHEVFSAAIGGFKVLEFAGRAAKPVLYVGALGAAFVALLAGHGWKWPPF